VISLLQQFYGDMTTVQTDTSIQVKQARPEDFDAIWPFFREIVKAGDTYPYPPEIDKSEAQALWFSDKAKTYIAYDGDIAVGSYYLKPNQPGLGSHVANAGYMVNPAYRGKGIGRMLGEHSITEARDEGYLAMQFNLVVSTNTVGVHLWKALGFTIIGTIPKAFHHLEAGYVDAYIMYRLL
jgi:GNAT superfamily N-acetyltransferase